MYSRFLLKRLKKNTITFNSIINNFDLLFFFFEDLCILYSDFLMFLKILKKYSLYFCIVSFKLNYFKLYILLLCKGNFFCIFFFFKDLKNYIIFLMFLCKNNLYTFIDKINKKYFIIDSLFAVRLKLIFCSFNNILYTNLYIINCFLLLLKFNLNSFILIFFFKLFNFFKNVYFKSKC